MTWPRPPPPPDGGGPNPPEDTGPDPLLSAPKEVQDYLNSDSPDAKKSREYYNSLPSNAEKRQELKNIENDLKKNKGDKGDKGDKAARISAPATVIVELPANAKLKFENHLTAQTSAHRVFTTPTIPGNGPRFYTLTAQLARDGKTQTVSQTVAVRAGKESFAKFTFPADEVTKK